MPENKTYSEDAIISLTWDEHVRKRPGMYVGTTDQRGLLSLFKELITACIWDSDTTEVVLKLNDDYSGELSIITTGIKVHPFWIKPSRKRDAGVEIGLMVFSALSNSFEICLLNERLIPSHTLKSYKGKFENVVALKKTDEFSGLQMSFDLDPTIWGDRFEYNPDFISQQLREYAYLNANTKFELLYTKSDEDCRVIYQFSNGLQHYLEYLTLDGLGRAMLTTTFSQVADEYTLDVAFAFREYSVDRTELKSYANNTYTFWEGSHVQGLFMGIIYALKRYHTEHQIKGDYDFSEENLRKSLIGAINIVHDAPVFVSSTRNKLGNEEIVDPISKQIAQHFYTRLIEEEADTKYFFQYHLARENV